MFICNKFDHHAIWCNVGIDNFIRNYMPGSMYQGLVNQYNELPWYKKAGFWVSAPRLAWGLFGYRQHPDEQRIKHLIQRAKASWFFKTTFEEAIYNSIEPVIIPISKDSRYKAIVENCSAIICHIAQFVPDGVYGATSRFYRAADSSRTEKITNRLLQAVAYGMESEEANMPIKASDAGNLFKSHLYAKELLQKSPHFLLERGDVTDWAGRTFKKITAFQYALWAKDFKMIKMMLECIPATAEGSEIWEELFEQAKQVTTPVKDGGGLTYTHNYDKPNLDESGIPDGTTTPVIDEEHRENHFNISPLCDAYQNYETQFNVRTWAQRDAYWTKFIGKLQRLLPVHILQRYCDPNTPFYPLPQFNGEFKRSTDFFNYVTNRPGALFGSALSSDFAIWHSGPVDWAVPHAGGARGTRWRGLPGTDLAAVRQIDEVSTQEIEKITMQLSQPRQSALLCP